MKWLWLTVVAFLATSGMAAPAVGMAEADGMADATVVMTDYAVVSADHAVAMADHAVAMAGTHLLRVDVMHADTDIMGQGVGEKGTGASKMIARALLKPTVAPILTPGYHLNADLSTAYVRTALLTVPIDHRGRTLPLRVHL